MTDVNLGEPNCYWNVNHLKNSFFFYYFHLIRVLFISLEWLYVPIKLCKLILIYLCLLSSLDIVNTHLQLNIFVDSNLYVKLISFSNMIWFDWQISMVFLFFLSVIRNTCGKNLGYFFNLRFCWQAANDDEKKRTISSDTESFKVFVRLRVFFIQTVHKYLFQWQAT